VGANVEADEAHPPDMLSAASRDRQGVRNRRVKSRSPSAKIDVMSSDTRELIEICEQLPLAKRVEVTDFARFLLAQQGDQRWEQIIDDTKSRPKLDEFLKQSRSEGSEPMDVNRL
jgi:hypothetical protein